MAPKVFETCYWPRNTQGLSRILPGPVFGSVQKTLYLTETGVCEIIVPETQGFEVPSPGPPQGPAGPDFPDLKQELVDLWVVTDRSG